MNRVRTYGSKAIYLLILLSYKNDVLTNKTGRECVLFICNMCYVIERIQSMPFNFEERKNDLVLSLLVK